MKVKREMNLLNNLIPALLISLILSLGNLCQAQEDQKKKPDEVFRQFEQKTVEDFDSFKDSNDSLFLVFLRNSWKEFQVFQEEKKEKPKPHEQPVFLLEEDSIESMPQKNNMKNYGEGGHSSWPSWEPDGISFYPGKNNMVDFFGEEIVIPVLTYYPKLNSSTQDEIIRFYKEFIQHQKCEQEAEAIFHIAREINLNDWGILYFLILSSQYYYREINNQVLYIWIMMQKMGYLVKVGHDSKNIFLLVALDKKIYNKKFITIDGQRFYIVTIPNQIEPKKGISTFEAIFAKNSKPVCLLFNQLPKLFEKPITREVNFNNQTTMIQLSSSLIQFMQTYPDCELSVYFNTPLSDKACQSLDKYLKPKLENKSETEKVNILLEFIQKAIAYQNDEEQFGFENYLFPDETLYFPYADCEDRAILFAQLVRRYTGLHVIGLDYPDHVTTGVMLPGQEMGDYILFERNKYVICDPTYIGAKAGMAMNKDMSQYPVIIKVE